MGKTVFLFPGQGSQGVGMGKNLYEKYQVARDVFKEAEDVLKIPLQKICFEGPSEELTLTQNTQPALLTVSTAMARVLESETEIRADLVCGHSLGEYSALVQAGALFFSDALMAVRARGEAMQEAVPVGKGAMAALIGGEADQVEALCQRVTQEMGSGELVVPANFNGGGQVVVSGTQKAVEKTVEISKSHGIRRAVLLEVSAPFHSPLMQPAADRMKEVLEKIKFHTPKIPYIANVDAKIYKDETQMKTCLIRQIPNPVQWEKSMQLLDTEGITHAYEVGPGKVLTGLLRRINKNIQVEDFSL